MSAPAINGSAAGQKQQLKGGKTSDGARKQTSSPAAGDSRNKQQSQPPAPKAWSGQNPSTLRASSSTSTPIVNGSDKPLPKLPQQSQHSNGTASNEKHAHDRALYLFTSFIGQDVTLTLKNGEQFAGIYSGASLDTASKQQYHLKMTKRVRAPLSQQVNGNTEPPSEYLGEGEDHAMSFDVQGTTALEVDEVNVAASQPMANGSATSFRTDTEISGRGPAIPRERELQRWDAGEGESLDDMALEGGGAAGWDQFAANERMYGVGSTYDENIYTTTINRSDPQYRQKEAQAARIAREIEGSSSTDAHVAEERRRDADRGDGLDEEEKYSGVQRESALPKRAAGAYVPPSQRPITTNPTVRGAPFDPAIISTTKPAGDKPTDSSNAAPTSSTTQQQPPVASEQSATAGGAGSTTAPKKSGETTAEDHIRATTDAFKQFANNEKLKIRQTQETKRQAMKQEKAVKLNDLKKFAANFKLKSRVPDDLVPILAKDHEKQAEIQKRADDAAKEEEVRATERAKQKSNPSSIVTSPVSSKGPEQAMADRSALSTLNHRARMPPNLRGSMMGGQAQGRGAGNGRGMPPFGRPPIAPLPENMRMPGAPAPVPAPAPMPMPMQQDAGPMSPGAAKKLNVNARAFEFRPGANAFTPTGTTPSPQRAASGAGKTAGGKSFASNKQKTGSFASKEQKKDSKNSEQPKNLLEFAKKTKDFTEEQKKGWPANGSHPQPYRAPPTWNQEEKQAPATFKESVPRAPQVPSQGPSPMHTPGPAMASQMPHVHQLPPHMQQGPPVAAQQQRPPYMAPQHQPHHPQYDPRMAGQPMYGPNGSVQNSPRYSQAQMAYGGGQMPMPQFGGQGGMPGYGMSPQMQYRQPAMQPPNPGMMMYPGMPPNHMPPMPSAPFPNPPAHFNQQPMRGQPPFMNGQHQGGPYSPMAHAPQPHHMGGPPQGQYNASPRPGPHMMQHTTSHQGFQGGGSGMMQPPYAPSPGGGHPMHMQQRQYSHGAGPPHGYNGMPQMTPRQGQAMVHPQQGMSPMGGPGGPGGMGQGDEGK